MVSRILVVDSNVQASAATEQLLGEAGYTHATAHSFEDAVRRVSTERPDLVVTAVRLGQFNGMHLVVRWRADDPDLPIVVIGEAADRALAAEAAKYGVHFLSKPTDPRQFLKLVATLLAESELKAANAMKRQRES